MSQNNNKDPIEDLFRKKADEYDIAYREEDWLKLEKKLDEHKQQGIAQSKRWLIAASVLLLFSLLGYAIYQNNQEIKRLNEQLQQQKMADSSQDHASEPTTSGSRNRQSTSKETGQSGNLNTDPDILQKTDPTYAQRIDNAANRTKYDSKGMDGVKKSSLRQFSISQNEVSQLAVNNLSCASCELSTLQENHEPALVSVNKNHIIGDGNQAVIASAFSNFPASTETRIPNQGSSRFSVGLMAGPDFSTVGSLSKFEQPGYNIGVSMEFHITENLSIRSGLIRSSVRYVADGREYRPPVGFWSYNMIPEHTFAECIILDIPLSLKYNVLHFDRSRLYATAGFSSYIMLNEAYQFDYAQANDHLVQEWNGKTGAGHWFSNASLSIGYEYDLNDYLSLRAEPFLKLPISEVGWGNVNLYSLGSFISFNYSFNRR